MTQSGSARLDTVLRAASSWRRSLVDVSGRNRLRRYRDLKTSTLDLTPAAGSGADVPALNRLLSDRPVELSQLFPEAPLFEGAGSFDDARRRLRAIHKTAIMNLEEKGIDTCFAAIGLASWEVEQGTAPNAPVVLLPLQVESTGAAGRDFEITVAGDAHLNPVLTHILRSEHDIETEDAEANVAEEPPTALEGFRRLLDELSESWSALPDLAIAPRVVVSIFSYSTMPLVTDLEANGEMFAENDVVAAMAGDPDAREMLQSRICDPDPHQPDQDRPADEFLVLDADSSQHMAINRVLGGESLVIQGPPGTGKSQTIANLISALVARGKRVLFVAEKRAAIEAVTKRLDQVDLGNLVMDMHGGVTSRRDFARTLADSLEHVATIPALDHSALHGRLQQRRDALVANDAALHGARDPWGLSVFEMQGRLLEIPDDAVTDLRLSTEAARTIDHSGYEQLADDIEEWVQSGGHTFAHDHPEWSRSTIVTSDEARAAFDLIRDLAHDRLPGTRAAVFAAVDEVGLARPETVAEWRTVAELLARLADTMESLRPDIFELDFEAQRTALAPARGSRWARITAQLLSREYRAARAEVQALSRDTEDLSTEAALEIVERAAVHVREWRERGGAGQPRIPEGLAALQDEVAARVRDLETLGSIIGLRELDVLPYERLARTLQQLASEPAVVAGIPRLREIEARFREAGITAVTDRVGDDVPPGVAARAVEHAWLRRILDDLEFNDRRLSAFDSDGHSRRREEFVEADKRHLQSTPQRVHRLTAEAIIKMMNTHPEEAALIRREAAKKRRHLSVRQLFARAPHVLSALRPCWTMSPVLAAEMIPADRLLFDVVVFDEASQIPPAEAIGSLARAPQAVIAGDSRQLPPTSFFGRDSQAEDEDEDEDVVALTADIESLLDAADALLRDNMLQWHYRSRDDRLIGFSNHHIYGGSLTAFPGATVSSPISHQLVPFRPIVGVTGTRSNPDEVERVVELILDHARANPDETLGVIAFGQHHADNIDNALTRRLSELDDPSLDDFFSEQNEERFFVKNIERVQGDERDVIILSVGYHKDANGNLPYRFGPILQEGGERRLNVAVTRARSRITLVSSFSHRDMDPDRSTARGVILLRQYLEYAASGGENLGADASDLPLNPFELSIKEGLERRGIPVKPQFGVSGYRIDFACAHPDEPGRMVLAIEADGASYHSTPTARDRDRLRQEVLENKGWRFHRIWSTAWFRDRESELDKAEQAWKQACTAAESGPAHPQAPPQHEARPIAATTPQRGARPAVPARGTRGYDSIADYSMGQLVELARWIESDTLLRTEEDLVRVMMDELGFRRRGKRITDQLSQAIRQARSLRPRSPR